MSPITIVLRSGMGMHIDSVRPYLRNGMPIAIGRAGAVISHFADGDAHLALRTIAEFPCPEQDNMPAANMRQIALAALSGAGASSEPGNPGGEPVSGPGVMAYIAERAKLLEEHDVALAEVGALKAELQSQRERNTELIFKLGSATNGWGRCEKERDAALAEVELLRQFERICEGLPQDAIDGGWTVQGIRGYAKRLEDQLKTALGQHNVPSGWKLVPLEPTPEMLDARRDSEDGMDGYLVEDTEYYFPDRGAVRDFLACVYRGLLAAAPAPGGEQ